MRRFILLFSAVVLLIAVGLFRFGETAAVVFPVEGASASTPDEPRPFEEGRTALAQSYPLSPCILGGHAGGRGSDYSPAGPVVPTRTSATGVSVRGGAFLGGDIRPFYGEIRPHLLFRRLRN